MGLTWRPVPSRVPSPALRGAAPTGRGGRGRSEVPAVPGGKPSRPAVPGARLARMRRWPPPGTARMVLPDFPASRTGPPGEDHVPLALGMPCMRPQLRGNMGFQPRVYRACLPLVRARVSGKVERLELHARAGDATRAPAARAAPSVNRGVTCAHLPSPGEKAMRRGLPVGGALLMQLRVPSAGLRNAISPLLRSTINYLRTHDVPIPVRYRRRSADLFSTSRHLTVCHHGAWDAVRTLMPRSARS